MTKTKEPVCGMEVDGKKTRDLVLGNVLQAVRVLEESRSFALLILEVKTNLVYAHPDAKSNEDVAGNDGRIPDIAYETGAVGKEHPFSLVAKSAVEVVESVIKLADKYIGGYHVESGTS